MPHLANGQTGPNPHPGHTGDSTSNQHMADCTPSSGEVIMFAMNRIVSHNVIGTESKHHDSSPHSRVCAGCTMYEPLQTRRKASISTKFLPSKYFGERLMGSPLLNEKLHESIRGSSIVAYITNQGLVLLSRVFRSFGDAGN